MSESSERCAKALISGTVQGVGFRYTTRESAESLGARGYVRNLPDRRVEAVFEGSDDVVERALTFVRHGPPGSLVTRVEVEELPPQGYTTFEIRH